MTPRFLVFVLPFCLMLASLAQAQDAGVAAVTAVPGDTDLPIAVHGQIDSFFGMLGQHKVEEAYDTLTKGTKIGERLEDMEVLKSKTQQAISMFGDVIGYDVVTVKHLGPHLLLATCLSLGKDFPLRWKLYFYAPIGGTSWRLLDIRVDDQLADMFGERMPASSGTAAPKQ